MLSGQAPKLYERVEGQVGTVTTREIAAAAKDGDAGALEAIQRAARYLAIGIANQLGAFHPDVVVLGGGVAQIGAPLLDTVRSETERRLKMISSEYYRIELSQVGDYAGVLGGVALAHKGSEMLPSSG